MSSRFNDGQPSVISTKRKRMERSLHSLRAVEMTERDPSTTLGMTVGVFGRKRGRSGEKRRSGEGGVQTPLARMASRHCSISQRGVLVAPQMPTVWMPSNHSD